MTHALERPASSCSATCPSRPATTSDEPSDFCAWADFTDETADDNPEWRMDLCEEVIGGWRGESGKVAAMTLVWGMPLVDGGASPPPSSAGLTVDQCTVAEDRFTLLAPDAYRGDYLEIALCDAPRHRARARVALRGRRRGRGGRRRVAVAVAVAVAVRSVTRSISP